MKYGKTHVESELAKINVEAGQQMLTLLLLPDKINKLEKRIAKLEKIVEKQK